MRAMNLRAHNATQHSHIREVHEFEYTGANAAEECKQEKPCFALLRTAQVGAGRVQNTGHGIQANQFSLKKKMQRHSATCP